MKKDHWFRRCWPRLVPLMGLIWNEHPQIRLSTHDSASASRGAFPYGSRTMSARPYAPDGFNHSGLVYGRRVKTKEYPKKSVSKSPLLKPRDLMCGIALKFYNSHTLDSKPCSKECAKNDRELNVTAARTICRLDQWAKTTNDVLGRSDYMIDQSPLICGDIWLLSRYDVTSSEMEVNLVPRGL